MVDSGIDKVFAETVGRLLCVQPTSALNRQVAMLLTQNSCVAGRSDLCKRSASSQRGRSTVASTSARRYRISQSPLQGPRRPQPEVRVGDERSSAWDDCGERHNDNRLVDRAIILRSRKSCRAQPLDQELIRINASIPHYPLHKRCLRRNTACCILCLHRHSTATPHRSWRDEENGSTPDGNRHRSTAVTARGRRAARSSKRAPARHCISCPFRRRTRPGNLRRAVSALR